MFKNSKGAAVLLVLGWVAAVGIVSLIVDKFHPFIGK